MPDTGEYKEMWIWVCTRYVERKGDICGVEKMTSFVPAPMPRRPSHSSFACTDPDCDEHRAQVEAFWYIFRQEEARMGRQP